MISKIYICISNNLLIKYYYDIKVEIIILDFMKLKLSIFVF